MLLVHKVIIAFAVLQIADFGMSRDLDDADYYLSNGGKIPFKWTAPEVATYIVMINLLMTLLYT